MVWKNEQVTAGETEEILRRAAECLGLPGDFVEMGCYRGDTSLLLAEVLRGYQRSGCGKVVENSVDKMVEKPVQKLWIYDSFEGLPGKSEADESSLGKSFQQGELYVSKREVKQRFLHANLPVPVMKKGWFSELTDSDMPPAIAFAFLDGDFYESIRDSLRLVGPKMVKNGIIIIHDYNNPALPGVHKAVDEWLKKDKRINKYFEAGTCLLMFFTA